MDYIQEGDQLEIGSAISEQLEKIVTANEYHRKMPFPNSWMISA